MSQRENATVVSERVWWIGFPLIGAGLGWLLKSLAGWVASLEWAPFQGPFRLVASLPEPVATIGAFVLGAAAGLVLAFLWWLGSLSVTVTDDGVVLKRGDNVQEIQRPSVNAVFLDGKDLVLLGGGTRELAREKNDLDATVLEQAFSAHGYTWLAEGDPYRDEFRRWVPDMPELSQGAHALFKARQRALEKDDGDDAAELRHELAKLGIVVRDEKKRQYWRAMDTGDRP
ncbi:hypothetical protein CDO52_17590 [Nocardiopsis gilva YIM 90087]|uniref:DUF308 domain-containing protein n=1 Tax=Nocardiopsis gilva YIM 90087 TaxID=1235441 RepID=A0A223S8C5_9ACTN|nr:hypothetical protein [Nocardiopsis gilva]ASU84370.1 hypothetical protein CDO52_17590 [Nocardiopsis gilva YIM 90087]